jgi:hypothetical protein
LIFRDCTHVSSEIARTLLPHPHQELFAKALDRLARYLLVRRTDGGTDVLIAHEGVPDGVPAADNETGTRMALANLAQLVERTDPRPHLHRLRASAEELGAGG